MRNTTSHNWRLGGVLAVVVGLATLPVTGQAQTLTGQASAVQATVAGIRTAIADTGTLTDASNPRDAGQLEGTIPGSLTGGILNKLGGSAPNLLSGETFSASTMGWADQVASQASLCNLGVTLAGTNVAADMVMSRALAVANGAGSGNTEIDNLRIGGIPIAVTGAPNQQVSSGALRIVLNEQIQTTDGITVNAIHVSSLDGLTDLVIGSAKAGISSMP